MVQTSMMLPVTLMESMVVAVHSTATADRVKIIARQIRGVKAGVTAGHLAPQPLTIGAGLPQNQPRRQVRRLETTADVAQNLTILLAILKGSMEGAAALMDIAGKAFPILVSKLERFIDKPYHRSTDQHCLIENGCQVGCSDNPTSTSLSHSATTASTLSHTASGTPTPSPSGEPREDGRCGIDFDNAPCDVDGEYGGCCSSHGYCG